MKAPPAPPWLLRPIKHNRTPNHTPTANSKPGYAEAARAVATRRCGGGAAGDAPADAEPEPEPDDPEPDDSEPDVPEPDDPEPADPESDDPEPDGPDPEVPDPEEPDPEESDPEDSEPAEPEDEELKPDEPEDDVPADVSVCVPPSESDGSSSRRRCGATRLPHRLTMSACACSRASTTSTIKRTRIDCGRDGRRRSRSAVQSKATKSDNV